MNEETIVAVFDTVDQAEAATRDLLAIVPESAISRHSSAGASAGAASVAPVAREPGFWSSLFGGEPDHSTELYDRSLEHGGVVLTVRTTMDQSVRVTEMLERHNPIDLEERASSYGLASTDAVATGGMAGATTGYVAETTPRAAGTEGDRIELSEESLSVGKRAVTRGTTRVRRFVVETPVQEDVSLREETVSVQRRPVTDGRAVNPDFSEKVIEMTETGEEAVVGKTAHVREEVVLSKAATERVETVHDTVRREDVKIETVPGTATPGTATPLPVRAAG